MIDPLRANPAPELLRLRQALKIDWARYNAWVDEVRPHVSSIIALHALDCGGIEQNDVVNCLRAEYVTRAWTGTL